MSYIGKLRASRAAAVEQARVEGGAIPRAPDLSRVDSSSRIGPPPSSNGDRPGIKARGASSAMLRQTIGDVFAAAERLGLSAALAAKHARVLEREVASLDKLHRALGEGPLAATFVRAFAAASDGLAAIDQTNGAAAVHAILESFTAAARRGAAIDPQRGRAIELFAASLSKLKSRELGEELARAITGILDLPAPGFAESAARAFAGAIDSLLQSATGDMKTKIVSAAASLVLDPHLQVRDAAHGLALTAGQEKLLTDLAAGVRDQEAKRAQAEAGAKANLEGQKRAFDANPQLAALAALKAPASQLAPAAQLIWYERINANARLGGPVVEALARVYLGLLQNDRSGLPTPDAQRSIDQAVAALAPQLGVTRIAAEYVASETNPERVPGVLRGLATIAAELARQNPNARDEATWVLLARGLSGRQDAFAQNNGPRAMLVTALAQAPNDEARRSIARHGARFAAAVKGAEAGATRDLLEAAFAADMLELAAIDLGALSATYPTIPEDSVARLAAIGLHRNLDLDTWFGKLTDLYKNARSNKEHQRSLRSLLALADRGGADPVRLVDAFLRAKPPAQQVMRAVNALLHQNNLDVKPEHIERAIGMLDRGEDVAAAIEGELRKAMVEKLKLDQLLRDANVKVTETGFKAVSGPLAQFFTLASNSPNVDKALLKNMLIAVLEDRFADFRFTTGATQKQLEVLSPWQRQAWMKSESMTHVRFEANGQKEFESRVTAGAKLGRALFDRMTAAWGQLAALEKKHVDTVEKLRALPKGEVEARRRLIRELDGAPAKIEALRWAKELSELTPATTTPLRFARLGDALPSLGRSLGPGMRPAIEELVWTIRIDDLAYSEVVTNDGPDLATMYKLATSNCLAGWPHDVSLLAYCIDPNKRMIVTKNQAGEARRAMMRIVERQDPGHAGEPMLVLERTYPDRVSEEEKQRLVEHMLRRASDMGIAAAYPTEYYWDASKTQRGQGAGLVDMNRVLEDLNRRYHTKSEQLTINVLNRAGNVAFEYIDSAPLAGARDAGNVQMRKYPGNQDKLYENKFVILSPE